MENINEHVRIDCVCGKDRKFRFILAYVDYHGIVPCAKCTHCGCIIPAFTLEYYKENGRMRLPI